MAESTFWLILAGLLLMAELATGTFYLLLLACGAALAALLAYLGLGFVLQIIAAAVFSVLSMLALRVWTQRNPKAPIDINQNQ